MFVTTCGGGKLESGNEGGAGLGGRERGSGGCCVGVMVVYPR